MLPFEGLTYGGQTRRLLRLAESALAAYRLDGAQHARVTPVRHMENAVFRVDAPAAGRRFCLRVHRPDYQTTDALRSEAALLAALREAGFAVPEPVAAPDGAPVTFAGADGVPGCPRRVTLLGWTEGRFLRRRVPAGAVVRAGAFLARLHAFSRTFAPPPGFFRPRLDAPTFLGRTPEDSLTEARPFLGSGDRKAILRAGERAALVRDRLGEDPSVYGLLHGDFHRGNFLVGPGGRVRAIDFDDCGWGHFLADVANAIEGYCSRPDGDELVAAFLRGYRGVLPLPDGYAALLPTFSFTRRLTALRWTVARQDNPRLRALTPRIAAECAESARDLAAGKG